MSRDNSYITFNRLRALRGERRAVYQKLLTKLDENMREALGKKEDFLLKKHSEKIDRALHRFMRGMLRDARQQKKFSRNTSIEELQNRLDATPAYLSPTYIPKALRLQRIRAALLAFKEKPQGFTLADLVSLDPEIEVHRFRYVVRELVRAGKLLKHSPGRGQGLKTLYKFPKT